jgi:hypothetical protein
MKFLLYLLLGISIYNCKQEDVDMKIMLYNKGAVVNYKLASDEKEKVNEMVKSIFSGIDEVLKLYFDENRLEDLKTSGEVLEIIYNEPFVFTTKEFGTFPVKKIAIPLTGDFIGNTDNPEITIITGEEEYDSTPFRNTTGYGLLMQLKELLENARE